MTSKGQDKDRKMDDNRGNHLDEVKVEEATWPGDPRVGLAIRRSRVRVPRALFVLGRPKFKSSTRFVNSQLVASWQLGFLILFMLYLNYLFLSI